MPGYAAAMAARPLKLSAAQARWFRARRAGLAGGGLDDAAAVAASKAGVQAQQLLPALWGTALRMRTPATADALRKALVGAAPTRPLVRTWGQRDTLHLYDPADWPRIVAARRRWAVRGRREAMPSRELVRDARARVRALGRPVLRSDLMDMIRGAYLKECTDKVGTMMDPKRLGAGRLIWTLAMEGELCFAGKVGQEQAYARRKDWFPELPWPRFAGRAAAVELTRAYLATNAPARAHDLAHFFGATVGEARAWLAELRSSGELLEVTIASESGTNGEVALARDEAALREAAPTGVRDWPVRLLPLWDNLLMSHADKTWTVPDEAERKAVWRKAAMVSATVLAHGCVVATWTHQTRARRVDLTVTPLSGWNSRKHLGGVKREAQAFAQHLGRDEAAVTVAR